ncbi:MAG: alpha/beta hydrolase, partial [Oscillospiraceae bacterium]|nr:alpha/beta hydrolase [Oscillospiraceae bacterium]
MKILIKAARIFLLIVLILGILMLICFINHRIQLSREEKILRQIGSHVNVDGNSMNVYTEGEGDFT